MSVDELLRFGLHEGQQLTAEELHDFRTQSLTGKAKQAALAKLARRAHSTQEIRDYLRRKRYEPEAIEQVLQDLQNQHLLNDEAFARTWVAERRQLKQRSTRELQAELRRKGVDASVVKAVLEDSEDDELAALKQLIAKKQGLSAYKDENKLIAYLQRKGYSYHTIKAVLSSPEE